jgi:hypothetical protein
MTLEEIRSAAVAKATTPAYGALFYEIFPREVVQFCSPGDAIEFGGWLTHEERLWLRDTVALLVCADDARKLHQNVA